MWASISSCRNALSRGAVAESHEDARRSPDVHREARSVKPTQRTGRRRSEQPAEAGQPPELQ